MRKSFIILAAAAPLSLMAVSAAQAHDQGRKGGHRGAGMEMMFDAFDADKDGAVTREEAEQKAASLFTGADINEDGALSRGEVIDGMQAQREARRAARFSEADADGDGALSAEEMRQMMETRKQRRMERRAARRLSRLDADNDGVVTAEEFSAARPGMRHEGRGEGRRGHEGRGHGRGHGEGHRGGRRHGGGMRGLVRMVDADHDQRITQAEIETAVDMLFERADKDENGAISLSELRDLAPMRGKGRKDRR